MGKGNIGFWARLFNLTKTYEKEKLKYLKRGPITKIFELLMLLGFAAGGIYLTYLSFGLFKMTEKVSFEVIVRFFGGILLLIIAAVIVFEVFGYMLMFALLFFKYKKPRTPKVEIVKEETSENNESTEEQPKEEPEKPVTAFNKKQYSKTSRAFDITFGTLYLILSLCLAGAIAGAIYLGFRDNPFNLN